MILRNPLIVATPYPWISGLFANEHFKLRLGVWFHGRLEPSSCLTVCCIVSVYCSVLKCVAVCCNVFLCDDVRCITLQCVAACFAVCGSVLQCVWFWVSLEPFFYVAPCCRVLQCVAVCCSAYVMYVQYVEYVLLSLRCLLYTYMYCIHSVFTLCAVFAVSTPYLLRLSHPEIVACEQYCVCHISK